MSEIVRNTVTISAPAETVFAFIMDPNTAPLRMPPELADCYQAHATLAEGDVRDTTYSCLGYSWTERRWVVLVESGSMKIIWHTNSRYNLREEWRVEALDAGRSRLVLERQLCPMTAAESLLWRLVTSHLINRVMDRRLRMTRIAIEGGWNPNDNLRMA